MPYRGFTGSRRQPPERLRLGSCGPQRCCCCRRGTPRGRECCRVRLQSHALVHMVPPEGLEPPLRCRKQILSLPRLPVPPWGRPPLPPGRPAARPLVYHLRSWWQVAPATLVPRLTSRFASTVVLRGRFSQRNACTRARSQRTDFHRRMFLAGERGRQTGVRRRVLCPSGHELARSRVSAQPNASPAPMMIAAPSQVQASGNSPVIR